MASPLRIHIIGLAGIIGTGKSTFMTRLQTTGALERAFPSLHILFVREPENLWQEGEHNWLHEFYEDRDMNAQPFQTIVFDTHVTVIERAVEEAHQKWSDGGTVLIVVERTMYDQLLFWRQQVDEQLKTTTPIFNAAYMKIWRRWMQLIPSVSMIFFLKTDNLQKTMQRLKRRTEGTLRVFHCSLDGDTDIQEVGGITLAYQRSLLEKHEAWYTAPDAHPPETDEEGVPCMHINVDAPYHEDDASLFQLAEEMAAEIKRRLVL